LSRRIAYRDKPVDLENFFRKAANHLGWSVNKAEQVASNTVAPLIFVIGFHPSSICPSFIADICSYVDRYIGPCPLSSTS
jgi:hypothetical protein